MKTRGFAADSSVCRPAAIAGRLAAEVACLMACNADAISYGSAVA